MNTHTRVNELGQPIGPALEGWKPPSAPPREALTGRWCRLEPLDAGCHAGALFDANARAPDARSWTYLPYGPFERLEPYRDWLRAMSASADPLFFAIVPVATGSAAGVASYLRALREAGSIEVGHIHYSPLLVRTAAATEAMFLMMRQAFACGYRRYEWKCDALNAPSRAAALRLGFAFEGVFRNAAVYKGRSRDTAWYAVTDEDWPALERAYRAWLAPQNFDSQGRQRQRLPVLVAAERGAPGATGIDKNRTF